MTTTRPQKKAFSIVTEEGELFGYFSNIIGLTGEDEITINDHKFHQLKFERGYPHGLLKRWCLNQYKWSPQDNRNVEILVLNDRLEPIGSYYLSGAMPIKALQDNNSTDECDVLMAGCLLEKSSPYALSLWDKWRICAPSDKNLWAPLSFDKRRGWLEIVRLYHCSKYSDSSRQIQDAPTKTKFLLDGSFITDYPSLFCAMGEAINGPGGYFGACLDSLDDCLIGGFGATTPFTLNWKQSLLAKSRLDRKALLREWIARSEQEGKKSNISDYDLGGPSLFDEFLKILFEHNVQVKLL